MESSNQNPALETNRPERRCYWITIDSNSEPHTPLCYRPCWRIRNCKPKRLEPRKLCDLVFDSGLRIQASSAGTIPCRIASGTAAGYLAGSQTLFSPLRICECIIIVNSLIQSTNELVERRKSPRLHVHATYDVALVGDTVWLGIVPIGATA